MRPHLGDEVIRKLTVGASLAAVVLLGYYAWSTLQVGLEPRKFMALVFLQIGRAHV